MSSEICLAAKRFVNAALRGLFITVMILGILLMLFGCLFVIENKRLAAYSTGASRHEFSSISSSVAQQNIAIIGGLLVVAGFGAFLFF